MTANTSSFVATSLIRRQISSSARDLGHEIKIETQGSIGTECELTAEDVAGADVVLISADILISGRERFKGKKIVELPMKVVLNSPKGVLNKIEEKLKGAE